MSDPGWGPRIKLKVLEPERGNPYVRLVARIVAGIIVCTLLLVVYAGAGMLAGLVVAVIAGAALGR